MISPITNTGTAAVDAQRVSHSGAAQRVARESQNRIATASTPAARLASLGPPIDINRVTEIRAAIAEGRYTVDADRLAAAMLALDLPGRTR
jgi:negative regulator of flagellin synthesis FlgM